ncbi:MAG: transglutaminase domain-containing protein [Ruminococcus sp.]|nr:transglutaminase domain-containing protein [Ruminococcus sp.]
MNTENKFSAEIRIVNNIKLTVPERKNILNRLPLIFAALMGFCGTIFSFFSMFELNIDTAEIKIFSLLYFAALTFLFMLPKKFHLIILPVLGLWIFLLYNNFYEFKTGFRMLFNIVYKYIYPSYGEYYTINNLNPEYIEIFLAFTIFILAVVVCYFIYSEPVFLLSFIFTFAILETGLYFGKSPEIIYVFMLIIYWVSLAALKYCGYYQKFSRTSSGFIRKNNMFIAKPGIKYYTSGISVMVITIVCCIIFILTALFSSLTGYKRSDELDNMRSDLKIAADEFSFDNFGESLERLSASLGFDKFKAYTHKLGTMSSIRFKNRCELVIETDGAIDTNLYLKGYTGSVYKENEWTDFPESDKYNIYNYSAEVDNYYDGDNIPQNMLTNYFLERYDMHYVNMNITSEYDAEKYNYIPYISIPDGKITYTDDTQISLENKKSYSFKVNKLQLSKSNLTDVLSGLDYSINDNFDEYTDYVYSNYCKVENTIGLNEVYKKFVKGTVLESDADIYQKLTYIKELLSKHAVYTLNPGRTPSGEDFVKYFLVNSKKGYCVHFATAGVILARMSGIPARYCDGYVLLADDFNSQNRQENSSYKIKIEDNRAHAWAEIYIKNLGWVPFEFTGSGTAIGEEETQATTAKTTETAKKTTKKSTSKISLTTKSETTSFSTSEYKNVVTSAIVQPNKAKLQLSIKIILILFFILLIAIIIIILRHIICLGDKCKKLNCDDRKKAITFAYKYTLDLLKFCGIEKGNMQYLEFSEYAVVKLPDILDTEFEKLTESMLRAQLSNEVLDTKEAFEAVQYYRKVYNNVYNKSNMLKKIEMRFIKNL